MTFAGDVPEGAYARLMKANFDRLIDGAIGAQDQFPGPRFYLPRFGGPHQLRRPELILRQRIEEEVEGVRDILGNQTALTGFYSYGEISSILAGAKCELHNRR